MTKQTQPVARGAVSGPPFVLALSFVFAQPSPAQHSAGWARQHVFCKALADAQEICWFRGTDQSGFIAFHPSMEKIEWHALLSTLLPGLFVVLPATYR